MALSVDDMVAMMHMLDADGDGTVSKTEFGIYYKRLKGIDDAAFDEVWRKIDTDGDGNLSVNELCAYYDIDSGECNRALQREKKREMSDEQLLEALQLQSLLNEERQRQEQLRKTHAARLKALAELVEEEDDDDDEQPVSSPDTVIAPTIAASPMTMKDLIRDSKRRGDIHPRFFEDT